MRREGCVTSFPKRFGLITFAPEKLEIQIGDHCRDRLGHWPLGRKNDQIAYYNSASSSRWTPLQVPLRDGQGAFSTKQSQDTSCLPGMVQS